MKENDKRLLTGSNNPHYKNIDGFKFGKLLVLDGNLENLKALVRCDCGNEIKVQRGQLTKRVGIKSCGKGICHPSSYDITGQKFGMLLVTKLIPGPPDPRKSLIWECQCDCGKIISLPSRHLRRNVTKSCGCSRALFFSQKMTLPNNQSMINKVFKQYKNHAKFLNLEFNLYMEEFKALISGDCHYCGSGPTNCQKIDSIASIAGENEKFTYNGIDRKNSDLAYEIDNCVSCCHNCNYAKRKLSYDDFIALAKRISARF